MMTALRHLHLLLEHLRLNVSTNSVPATLSKLTNHAVQHELNHRRRSVDHGRHVDTTASTMNFNTNERLRWKISACLWNSRMV